MLELLGLFIFEEQHSLFFLVVFSGFGLTIECLVRDAYLSTSSTSAEDLNGWFPLTSAVFTNLSNEHSSTLHDLELFTGEPESSSMIIINNEDCSSTGSSETAGNSVEMLDIVGTNLREADKELFVILIDIVIDDFNVDLFPKHTIFR